jgi:hypothetical protein
MNMTTGFPMPFAALVPPALSGFAPADEVGTFGRGARIPADLAIVCLWAAVGLVLTDLFASLGFGNEIAQFLAAAG